MAEKKISQLPSLSDGELDLDADWLLVSDVSAGLSKKIAPRAIIAKSLPYVSTRFDFLTGSLLPTVSFTRASSGYRFNSSGLLVSETTDAPRFEYDPATLTPRGLLVEEARTEMLLQSEDATTAWTISNASITPNVEVAPDGATTMDKFVENSAASVIHALSRQFVHAAATPYVYSVVAKAAERSWLLLSYSNAAFGSTLRAWFDVANGVVGTLSAGVKGFIEPLGGGLYRCYAIATSTTGGNASWGFTLAPSDGVQSYTGDGVSGIYIWGMQAQVGDTPASYIQTTGSQVTRSADVVLITNPLALTDQCWVLKARTPREVVGVNAKTIFQIDDGTNSNRRIAYLTNGGSLRIVTSLGNVTQSDINLGVVTADTDISLAIRFADNNFAASLNGGAIVSVLSGTNPTGLTTARVGRSVSSSSYWNSTIRYIETRRTATDAELVLLST